MDTTEYNDNLEILTALISHLGLVKNKSRVPSRIAISIGWEKNEVVQILNQFKALFRKSSKHKSKDGEHFYTLQLRYALKHHEYSDSEEDDKEGSPLDVKSIIDFIEHVSEKAARESETHLALKEIRLNSDFTKEQLRLSNKEIEITNRNAKIAALAAIAAAVIPLIIKWL